MTGLNPTKSRNDQEQAGFNYKLNETDRQLVSDAQKSELQSIHPALF